MSAISYYSSIWNFSTLLILLQTKLLLHDNHQERGCQYFPPDSWYFHWSSDQRCPDMCHPQLHFLHSVSLDSVSKATSGETKVDTCFTWSAIQNARHIIWRHTVFLPWPNQWNEHRKRHIHIPDSAHMVLSISLKLLSSMSFLLYNAEAAWTWTIKQTLLWMNGSCF